MKRTIQKFKIKLENTTKNFVNPRPLLLRRNMLRKSATRKMGHQELMWNTPPFGDSILANSSSSFSCFYDPVFAYSIKKLEIT